MTPSEEKKVDLDRLIELLETSESGVFDLENNEVKVLVSALRLARSAMWKHFGPFICGYAGEKDENGLPETLFVSPMYGCDGFASYKKDRDYDAPGW